jgi:release factor glutamine methyltransferase
VSSEAVAVAWENAARHGVADRVDLRTASYLDGVEGAFDLIAANPPYVRDGDRPALAADVKHEPDVALFGGQSGLRNIEGVLDTAIERLVPGGWLLMEFGFGQDDDVAGLVAARPALRLDRIVDDLQGIPRMAIVQRER